MSIEVSFIIPHKGREEMLRDTVASIFSLDFELDRIEVLVVTQNDELQCLSEFSGQNIQAIFPEKGVTISAQRNIGAKKAKGQYFAFLDADVALSNNWLQVMIDLLAQAPSRKLVSAMQINSDTAPVLEKIRTVLSNAELDENVSFLPGRNLFLHRETFEQVGGFPEHLITCEDYYFTDQVNQLGDLYYSSEAQYVHIGEDKELGMMYQKEVWRGQSNLQSIKGRNVPLREIPSFLVPPLIILLLLLVPVFALMHSPTLAILALLFGIAPIVIYSLRLFSLADGDIPFKEILKFYLTYFPARAKGTVLGLWRSFGNKETD